MNARNLAVVAALALVGLISRATRADDATDAFEELKRGYALRQKGDCAQAVPHFARSLGLQSTAKALLNLSDCEARLGNLAGAREHAAAGRTLAGLQGDAELVSVADQQLSILDRAQSSPARDTPSPDPRAREQRPPGSPTVAWVAVGALGVGAVGLAIGIGAGVAAESRHATLARECASNGACPSSEQGAIDDFHGLKTWSTAGYAVGAAGLIAAGVLWLVRPGPPTSGVSVRAWAGIGSAGVAGTF